MADNRRELIRQEQARLKRAERRRTVAIWGVAAAVVIAVVATFVVTATRTVSDRPDLGAVQTFQVTANHTSGPVRYDMEPPVGGDHRPSWLNCGIYEQAVPNEYAVHALEHGAVWVTYQPELAADQVGTLRDALPNTYTVLSPYPGQDAPVIASAWGHQLRLDNADDPRLAEFIRTYRMGPQTPEPGAACTGGLDAPGKVA
ncbi:MAG: DUF3105 domain-containing protein [Propionibacteriaceae bacterium]|nr:DUF3105 domain-containing protein [Propionibacteriaceae bacterium]